MLEFHGLDVNRESHENLKPSKVPCLTVFDYLYLLDEKMCHMISSSFRGNIHLCMAMQHWFP